MSRVDQRIDVHCGREGFDIHNVPVLSGVISMRLGAPTVRNLGRLAKGHAK